MGWGCILMVDFPSIKFGICPFGGNTKEGTTATHCTSVSNPLYSNPGGTGDRRSVIVASAYVLFGGLSPFATTLVSDGATWLYFTSQGIVGRWIMFDFGSFKLITESTFTQNNTHTHGYWKWQASNDALNWTDIGVQFQLGGSTSQTLTELSSNTVGYIYYRLLGISGLTSSTPRVYGFEFKLDEYNYPLTPDAAIRDTSMQQQVLEFYPRLGRYLCKQCIKRLDDDERSLVNATRHREQEEWLSKSGFKTSV
jgi:hypothetical protein